MSELSIIIPTINREAILKETLQSLNALCDYNFEVIVVVDANSKIPDIDTSQYKFNITIVNNSDSGAASNRNLGARIAKSEYLLFLDDDIILDKTSFQKIIEFRYQFPNSCMNPNWIYSKDILNNLMQTPYGRFLLKHKLIDYKSWVFHSNWQEKTRFKVNVLSAFCLLIPKSVFYNVGQFNTIFKYQSVEDDEFSKRLFQKNIDMYIDTNITVFHNEKDRIHLVNRLKRLQIGAYNKRLAYELGHKEYYLKYPLLKVILLNILSFMEKFFLIIAQFAEKVNLLLFDWLYFKLVHLLIAIYIFKGYYKRTLN